MLKRPPEKKPRLPEPTNPDQVEQASLDSFPASDPPSWIPVHSGRPAETVRTDDRAEAEATTDTGTSDRQRG